jgi:hypothetical protein
LRCCEETETFVDLVLGPVLPKSMIVIGKWDYLPGRPIKSKHHHIRTDCSDYGVAELARLRFLCGTGLFYSAEQYLRTVNGAKEIDAPDRKGKTPLYYVLERAKLFKSEDEVASFIGILLRNGAKPNVKPYNVATLLVLALQEQLDRCAEALITGGADVNESGYGGDPLRVLMQRKPDALEKVKWLLSKGAVPLKHTPRLVRFLWPGFFESLACCALDQAAGNASPEMVELLLAYVKPKELNERDSEQLIREAMKQRKFSNLKVILAAPQIRRVMTEELVSLVRTQLAGPDPGTPEGEESSESQSQSDGDGLPGAEVEEMMATLEQLGADIEHRRVVDLVAKTVTVSVLVAVTGVVWYKYVFRWMKRRND